MAAWEGFTDAELQKIQNSGVHSANLKSKNTSSKPKIVKPVFRKKNNVVSASTKGKTNNIQVSITMWFPHCKCVQHIC